MPTTDEASPTQIKKVGRCMVRIEKMRSLGCELCKRRERSESL